MPEPRDPLLKVLTDSRIASDRPVLPCVYKGSPAGGGEATPPKQLWRVNKGYAGTGRCPALDNDPSEGSPTETLLRLLLPLNDQV